MLARWGFMLAEVFFDVYESQFQLTKSLELKFKVNITKIWVFKSHTTLFHTRHKTTMYCLGWVKTVWKFYTLTDGKLILKRCRKGLKK